MSLLLSGDLRLRHQLPADAEADAYIAAVEAADGQALEPGVKFAIKNFVLCCKQDGIWDAIKACCILAGARTRLGALTPLVGTAPTSFNFVDGDYNRKTGLVGDGSTKYLDSNRSNSADPQNNKHASLYLTSVGSGIALSTISPSSTGSTLFTVSTIRINSGSGANIQLSPGLVGASRSEGSSFSYILKNSISSMSATSATPLTANIGLLRQSASYGSHGIAFYSIGESLNLALLDARVTDLINAFGAAIP